MVGFAWLEARRLKQGLSTLPELSTLPDRQAQASSQCLPFVSNL
jgi:hypothetical protein